MAANSLGQLVLVGVPGPELDAETASLFRSLQPAGFIIFGRNICDPAQLRRLLDDLRSVCREEPILTIDQEGGRVSRLRLLGHEPPNAQQLRDAGDASLISRHGDITARLLRLFGFNLDLCPVLDISLDDEADNSLRGRCYGKTAEEVVEKAGMFNRFLRAGGILSCGKHFPGYTNAGLDPHHDLPRIERSRAQMEALELVPFRALLDELDSMMIGHIAVSGLDDSGLPASLSPAMIQGLLRDEMGFRGLVMTDDLDMGAILEHFGFAETMCRALEAGNDLLMICHRVELAARIPETVGGLPAKILDRALENVAALRKKFQVPESFSLPAFAGVDGEVRSLRAAVLGDEFADKQSPENGKRSPVELY
jgi:beta-N-acetylhexosaminidase